MYHGLVRIDGEWVSFGIHIPSPRWTSVFQAQQCTYGHANVRYVFWSPDDQLSGVADVRSRAESDVQLANEAQRQWDAGELRDADDGDNQFNLARGVRLLRQVTT